MGSVTSPKIGVNSWPRFIGNAASRATETASHGEIPGITKVDYAGDMVVGGIVIGGLILGGIIGGSRSDGPRFDHRSPSPEATPPFIMQAVPVPPPKEGETLADVLRPNGQYVGKPGENSGVRELPGGKEEAHELFDRLTKGGKNITPPGHIGQVVKVPDGVIGYRPESKSGPPAIDVIVRGLGIRKLKFPGGAME